MVVLLAGRSPSLWSVVVVVVVVVLLGSCSCAARRPPNVVVFLVDDLGYGDLACYGNTTIKTPNIDRLARSGVLFNHGYAAAPICTPSRAALLTGRYAVRTGMESAHPNYRTINSPAQDAGLPLSEVTIATALRSRGYKTALIGKWHLGINGHEPEAAATNGDSNSDGDSRDEWRTLVWSMVRAAYDEVLDWANSVLGFDEARYRATQNGTFLPTRHGFDVYYGMPVTNVQSCQPGKKIYSQRNLVTFVLSRTAHVWASIAAVVLVGLAVGVVSRRVALLVGVLMVVAFAYSCWFVGSVTLVSRQSCVLYRGETLVEQPVQLQNLTVRLTYEAVAWLNRTTGGGGGGGGHRSSRLGVNNRYNETEAAATAAHRAPPFFLMMSYIKVHTALFTTERFRGVSAAGAYGDNVEEMDWSVGAIMRAIEAAGVANDTLVFFTSDNGPFLERFREGGWSGFDHRFRVRQRQIASAVPHVQAEEQRPWRLRGGKGQTWEGGVRVPFIVSWPSVVPPALESNAVTSHLDIFATVTSLAGYRSTRTVDGVDLMPFLVRSNSTTSAASATTNIASAKTHPHDFLFMYCGTHLLAIRHRAWKAHWATAIWEAGLDHCPDATLCGCEGKAVERHDAQPLLFNLDRDPSESHAINATSAEYQRVMAEIMTARDKHLRSMAADSRPSRIESAPWRKLMPVCDFPNGHCEEKVPREVYDWFESESATR